MEKIKLEDIESLVNQLASDVTTMRDLKGITTEEMEAVYSVGFNFYNSGAYENAEKIFKFLVLFDHMTPKYWIGLGAVLQATKRYEEAIGNYCMASLLNMSDPKPQYYAAECHFASGNLAGARSALECLRLYATKDSQKSAEFLKMADELESRITYSQSASAEKAGTRN